VQHADVGSKGYGSGCSAEIVAGSVDGTVRRFDVRAGLETADDLGGLCGSALRTRADTDTIAQVPAGQLDASQAQHAVCGDVQMSAAASAGAAVTSVAVSHDGHCLLASCMDGAARLLDKEGGELLATYRGAPFASCLSIPFLSFPFLNTGGGL
jgi:WD40 repeat protein